MMIAQATYTAPRDRNWGASAFANGILQRKCACGNHARAAGECEMCGKKRESLQRKPADENSAGDVPPIVHEAPRSPGQPLDAATRAFMEPRFGRDFSLVRVHAGTEAERSADAINARANTVGHDIVFAAGEYVPATTSGERLLAHELAHVARRDAAPQTSQAIRLGETATSERETDHAAETAVSGERYTPTNIAKVIGLQHKEPASQPTTSSMLGGGVLAGALLGGATARVISDDRKKGPQEQTRRRLQPKLRTSRNHDPLEQEADDWASRVLAGRDAPAHAHVAIGKARKEHPSDDMTGEPLGSSIRWPMESSFGRDFSGVRVHRDLRAHRLADDMNAYAVTSGSDIYFARDGFAPETPQGRAILAHELAHVAQNDIAAPKAPAQILESEATDAVASIGAGRVAQVRHGGDQKALALTRTEETLAGAGIGVLGVGAVGALIGLGAAGGAGALVGGLIGAGVGAVAGGLIGYFTRRTESETSSEAEALIQRRYGRYLRGGATGPLHNARVHVVSDAELCERFQCRHPGQACDLIGWTDTGVPVTPRAGPKNQPPPIQSQADEPVCNGRQMEHATPERPVIYYVRNNKTAGTLIHEGLHAHSHPSFAYLHNYLVEGATEYFTRRLQDEINMPYTPSYDDNVRSVEKLVDLVGEEILAQTYFSGSVPELHQAVNARLGRCALAAWSFSLQAGSFNHADQIMQGRNQDYCHDSELLRLGVLPAAMTPAQPASPSQEKAATRPKAGGHE